MVFLQSDLVREIFRWEGGGGVAGMGYAFS